MSDPFSNEGFKETIIGWLVADARQNIMAALKARGLLSQPDSPEIQGVLEWGLEHTKTCFSIYKLDTRLYNIEIVLEPANRIPRMIGAVDVKVTKRDAISALGQIRESDVGDQR